MTRAESLAPVLLAVAVAVGCGGGRPQEAAAGTDHPLQLAEAPAAAPPGSSGGSASVTGTVRFEGTAPAAEKIRMDADPVCQQQHTSPMHSEEVVVNDNGTLKNVFVYVKEGVKGSYPPPSAPVRLEQIGCWYAPHVFGIQVGEPLEIVNNDATLHNVNVKPTINTSFNIAQTVKGMKSTKVFSKPELPVRFKCNVHPWMNAYAGVLEHPFFSVTGAEGSFAITGLPAGTYVLEAWHEKYGTQTQTISVDDGESKTIELTFKAQ